MKHLLLVMITCLINVSLNAQSPQTEFIPISIVNTLNIESIPDEVKIPKNYKVTVYTVVLKTAGEVFRMEAKNGAITPEVINALKKCKVGDIMYFELTLFNGVKYATISSKAYKFTEK
jgi:hypothetical protein